MHKNRLLFLSIICIFIACGGVFFWHTQRQKNYAKTRELYAPIYSYSGKLTAEQQKSYIEYISSITEGVKHSDLGKYKLPKRELLQLEAHSMSLHRDNPELVFREPLGVDKVFDIRPYRMHFSLLALIAKTKLADIPAKSRKKILQYLETLSKRLTKNSVETYIEKVKNTPPGPNTKLPPMAFGIQSIKPIVGDEWIMEADGSFHFPEGGKRGALQITDTYGNEYTVDFDSPTDTGITESTVKLHEHIDILFEYLSDEEFQRLASLSKAEVVKEIDMLFPVIWTD